MPAPSLRLVTALVAAVALLAPVAPGQLRRDTPPPPLAAGDPALPELPSLRAGGRRDTLRDADRFEVRQDDAALPATTGPTEPTSLVLDASITGTGHPEPIALLVPPSPPETGALAPLLVAWHGFGNSAASVAKQTTLDEHCAANGWYYLSVTGLDDKLFGSLPAQQHVEAAIRWVLEHHPVDRDRIALVGFSMGAGAAVSFAARHRDPDGVMIAAVACVSGAFDWTLTWHVDPAVRPWLHAALNFGGPPQLVPFEYQRVSGLAFAPPWPPWPGPLQPVLSMAGNLAGLPVYVAWDGGDPLLSLPEQSSALASLLGALGAEVAVRAVQGTLDPGTGLPAPHSWAVLDEADLFAFLQDRVVVRRPASWRAQLDRDARVSWGEIAQRESGAFSWIAGAWTGGELRVTDAVNVARATADVAALDGAGWPLRVTGASADGHGLLLAARCDQPRAGWFTVAPAVPAPRQEWDPDAPSVGYRVPPHATLAARLWPAAWSGALRLSPAPAPLGSTVGLTIEAPAGTDAAFLVVQLEERFFWAGGHLLLVSPVPPGLVLPLGLLPDGSAACDLAVPNDPWLQGLRLLFQAALVRQGQGVVGTTNPYSLDLG